MNHWIDGRIKDEMDKTGAVYIPALNLDSSDQEVVNKVTDYQNHFAKLYGEREIMPVITKQYDRNGPGEEFADFFDQVAKGNVTRGGAGDMVDHSIADEQNVKRNLTESRNSVIKTISNFSDFK
jgi:hypothetical protein